jgi:hypothetical protein
MYERGFGRVINVSSVHGLRASKHKAAYVAAKHGLEGLSKVTAMEGGPHGVTSNCVNPSYVRTPLVDRQVSDQARAHGISEDEVVESVFMARNAIKRFVEPVQVCPSRGVARLAGGRHGHGCVVHDGRRFHALTRDRDPTRRAGGVTLRLPPEDALLPVVMPGSENSGLATRSGPGDLDMS